MNNPVSDSSLTLLLFQFSSFIAILHWLFSFLFFSCFYQVGKSYKDPYDNCTQYTCTESAGQFSLTSTIKVCLPFEEANCVPVSILQPEKDFWNKPWCWPGSYLCCFEWVFLDLSSMIILVWRKCAFSALCRVEVKQKYLQTSPQNLHCCGISTRTWKRRVLGQ